MKDRAEEAAEFERALAQVAAQDKNQGFRPSYTAPVRRTAKSGNYRGSSVFDGTSSDAINADYNYLNRSTNWELRQRLEKQARERELEQMRKAADTGGHDGQD